MKTAPVIIGALRLVKKGTENYIGKIPGNFRIPVSYRRLSSLQLLTYLGGLYPLSNPEDLQLS